MDVVCEDPYEDDDSIDYKSPIAIGAPSPDPITDWMFFILAIITGGIILCCAINRH